jgi:hypothetical protein
MNAHADSMYFARNNRAHVSGLSRRIAGTLALAASTLVCVLAAAACGDSSTTGTSEPIDQYATRYAHAACDELEKCCAENGLSPYDQGNCLLGGAAFVQGGVDGAKAAGAAFDQKAADDCITAVTALTKQCKSPASDPIGTAACGRVFNGAKRPGEACSKDLDCSSTTDGTRSCYKKKPNDATGTCITRKVPAAVGDKCAITNNDPVPNVLAGCDASGLYCDLAGTCQPRVSIGGKCGALLPCNKENYCSGDGTCAAALATGATCTLDTECASGACAKGKCGVNGIGRALQCLTQTK